MCGIPEWEQRPAGWGRLFSAPSCLSRCPPSWALAWGPQGAEPYSPMRKRQPGEGRAGAKSTAHDHPGKMQQGHFLPRQARLARQASKMPGVHGLRRCSPQEPEPVHHLNLGRFLSCLPRVALPPTPPLSQAPGPVRALPSTDQWGQYFSQSLFPIMAPS